MTQQPTTTPIRREGYPSRESADRRLRRARERSRVAATTEQTVREARAVVDLAFDRERAEVDQRHHDARHADGRCSPACTEAGGCDHEDTAAELRELEAVEAVIAPSDDVDAATEEHHYAWANWLLMAKQLAIGGSVDWQRQRQLLAAEAPPNLCREHHHSLHERTTEAAERCILQQIDDAMVRRDGVWDASDFEPREVAAHLARLVAEYEAADRATAEAAGPDGVAASHAEARAELTEMIGAPLGPLMIAPGDRSTYSISIGGRVLDLGERGPTFAEFDRAVMAAHATLPARVQRRWRDRYMPALMATAQDAPVGRAAFRATRAADTLTRYLGSPDNSPADLDGEDAVTGRALSNAFAAGRPLRDARGVWVSAADVARWMHITEGERSSQREVERDLAAAGLAQHELRRGYWYWREAAR